MYKRQHIFLAMLFTLLFTTSCFKDDERIVPHKPGDYITDTVVLFGNYSKMVYYDLETQTEVCSMDKDSWDLGFENSAEGWKIILNGSCFMKSARVINKVFGEELDTTGLDFKFKPSDGSADSIEFGKWFNLTDEEDTIGNGSFFVIDAGLDKSGQNRGMFQLILDSLKNSVYYFRFASLSGENITSAAVTKSGEAVYRHYSFITGNNCPQEPSRFDWDLLFTQYTTLLFTDVGDPYPYVLTGVLTNDPDVTVFSDSIMKFSEIKWENVRDLPMSNRRDYIGYDWKTYDFNNNTYKVDSEKSFIIKDIEGYYFRFRFIGFTNQLLEKGFISFEYSKL